MVAWTPNRIATVSCSSSATQDCALIVGKEALAARKRRLKASNGGMDPKQDCYMERFRYLDLHHKQNGYIANRIAEQPSYPRSDFRWPRIAAVASSHVTMHSID